MFLERFRFTDEQIDFLKLDMPHAEPAFFEYLRALDARDVKVHGF